MRGLVAGGFGAEVSVGVRSVVGVGEGLGFERLGAGALLAVLDAALDALTDQGDRPAGDAERLELLAGSVRVSARLHAWQARLAAEVDAAESAWHEHGTSTATWLADVARLTRAEAGRLVAAGQRLDRFEVVGASARAGAVLPGQADAITGVLEHLPDALPGDALVRAQELMVGFAATHNATELRRLSGHLLEVLAPEVAEELESARVEREYRQAMRGRSLSFHPDGHGSVLLRGSLPTVHAEGFMAIIDAYAAAGQRGLDALDPEAEYVTQPMRRADALIAMVAQHQRGAAAPAHGGDRPRVVVTTSYDRLLARALEGGGEAAAGLLEGGEPVPPSVLRQWLCDADLMPAVLGGAGEVLDIGRTRRLVTPALRAALAVRDGGCVFPGCDKPPDGCQAHHIVPWWCGGATSLSNLVLVCPHHHGIVEPGHDPTADRWRVLLGGGGLPEVVPPRRVDPGQRPRVHARFRTSRRQ